MATPSSLGCTTAQWIWRCCGAAIAKASELVQCCGADGASTHPESSTEATFDKFAFSAITVETEEAGLETTAPKSCSPLEYRGLSAGAELPVISAVVAQLTSPHTRLSSSCSDEDPAKAIATKLHQECPPVQSQV